MRYTTGEKLSILGNAARGVVRIQRGRSTAGVDARLDSIEQRAAERHEREALALARRLEEARNAAALAKADKDRAAARAAEKTARDLEARLRRYL
ncbi:hypothetical protein [Streptomyces chilikensis]|uniref:Uncharacterized protein n=1 Tax=Streptomyces chilikensis TaxID=1194079 RepID=A0ABV3EXX0_9ACTN